ncbi:MAG: bifunctional methylenetetrahydrofolate dehydrogenase/methenyltetrahydrofolate cyclohydrolase FolD [candidate division Zixibacteria bacterium]|nr:bifunctional methylenetetrahydrofolate dehydrogenase/methenyltetrahydrofolate cyclohydrolase FolD [candidate division Zixibacteria bacterium]
MTDPESAPAPARAPTPTQGASSESPTGAKIIDGKVVSLKIRDQLAEEIKILKNSGVTPGLAAVLVGEDPASNTYVRAKAKACAAIGVYSDVIRLAADISQVELERKVRELNIRDDIDGILVQSPLPAGLNEFAINKLVDPAKDVDGFHPYNVGMLSIGEATFVPCTPVGIIKLLEHYSISTSGKEAVVVGRSNIVGKPIAALLASKCETGNATVTICHSRTRNLSEVCRKADILIAAIGSPGLIGRDYIKPGAVIIDVGINRVDDPSRKSGYRLIGDVKFDEACELASYITPVPGGVGPMTIAMLLSNTVKASRRRL